MVDHIEFEQWVPVPIEHVFLFFANPHNLPRIMPPETRTALDAIKLVPPPSTSEAGLTQCAQAGVGSEIITSFRVLPFLPFRSRWIALITEFEWNHHFADVQKKGPFKTFHHRHQLISETRNRLNGTRVCDVIDYEVGFGWAGRLLQKTFIRRQLQRTFRYRQQALEKLLS